MNRHGMGDVSRVVLDFSITLSPTYQVPVLWFTVTGLPRGGPQGIEAIYHHVVPSTFKVQVKETGVMGGISMAVSVPPLDEAP